MFGKLVAEPFKSAIEDREAWIWMIASAIFVFAIDIGAYCNISGFSPWSLLVNVATWFFWLSFVWILGICISSNPKCPRCGVRDYRRNHQRLLFHGVDELWCRRCNYIIEEKMHW
ncbi:MAG: hypothetical protein A2556_01780 [Candidatus Vogelbacteria bacterium RIFOXYD2_FULL_44_9]|uniref:Uncharacterized protein n=1 Tax=Candidatus Vogelbacteria bacterium RIFOXYD2_FULL_44_9 TaxID=1802441 RepID=A0A1G2QPL2_9BACT|nr:MAG: hypothetical protein A2556_01780 [Candidatus Vogelbacteria bacterium RIFOXYD2_FULL_44_9]